jgi:protein tyrosine phosphatase (PTP) superfamily phosphohydrolase (DUF442 family)
MRWKGNVGNWAWVIVAATISAASAVLILFRDHWQVQNFYAVELGAIYRGAEQKAGPLRRIIREYGIRTIVCLVDPEPDERLVAESQGVRWVWMPLCDSSLAATFDTLEKFADVVADPRNQPVFYHCRRGVYRSNLAQAVYRIKCCGWTLDETLAELRSVGFNPEDRGGDNCCVDALQKYYHERILGRHAVRDGELPLSAN